VVDSLDVYLWRRKVGTLVADSRNICFYFDEAYVRNGYDIAPTIAPISGVVAQRGLPVYPAKGKIFGGLPSFIADSLPDHWGSKVFNEWAKSRHIAGKRLTALDRLAYIGKRGMGALEFVPSLAAEMETPFKVEIADLYDLARQAFDDAKKFKASSDLLIESLFKVGTSAGGKRPKAVININEQTGECYSGQVATPMFDFVPMIIKFDEHAAMPTTRIEYSYYFMARSVGLPMMPCSLLENRTEVHFLTERFDRCGNEKLHVQTLAAMNPDADSYEDLLDVAFKLGVSQADIEQLFLQMVMNILAGNVDDHSKNFSFIMDKEGDWRVAPLYDFTFTVDPDAPSYMNRHSMTVCNKNHDISEQDLLAVAKKYNIKSPAALLQKAVAAVEAYPEFAGRAGVAEPWIAVIAAEIGGRLKKLKDEK
jgi:serine/threonine-protein kinase HipA